MTRDFEIDKSSGVLSFMESPNYEMATGGGASGTSNTYSVTVVATDADGMTSEKTVTVEVTNVDEAGKVSLDKVAPYPCDSTDCRRLPIPTWWSPAVRSGSGPGR